MARKKPHEDHVNHEAWAIPYGDLLVLLLAFFVVMYAVSSVNEGKYRVLADSLQEAFGGPPKSIKPVQFGNQQKGSAPDSRSSPIQSRSPRGSEEPRQVAPSTSVLNRLPDAGAQAAAQRQALQRMGDQIAKALGGLIEKQMVRLRRNATSLEVEIRTDILYASGSSQLAPPAKPVLEKLAGILKDFPNELRVEGYTDSIPINTAIFPSNWELSSARAASVVHLFMQTGVDPQRMSVAGFGEYRAAADNATAEGRNANRRVVIVIQAKPGESIPVMAEAEADASVSSRAEDVAAMPARLKGEAGNAALGLNP